MTPQPGHLVSEQLLLFTLMAQLAVGAVLSTMLVRFPWFRAILLTEKRDWPERLIFAASLNRAEAVKTLMARGADASVTTKVIDIAKFSALDRAAAEKQREVIGGFVAKDSESKATPSQVAAAIEAGRTAYEAGLMEMRDMAAPSTPVAGTPFFDLSRP